MKTVPPDALPAHVVVPLRSDTRVRARRTHHREMTALPWPAIKREGRHGWPSWFFATLLESHADAEHWMRRW